MQQAINSKEIKEMQAKTSAILEKTGYYSILAYARIMGVSVTKSKAQILGKQATKISKQKNISIGRVPDERWGSVNTYHEDILKDLYDKFFSDN